MEAVREERRERKSERMEGEPERWRRGWGEGGHRECMVELMCVFMHDWLEIAIGPPTVLI